MPSRSEIKPQVVAKIAGMAHLPPAKVAESHALEDDLGMTATVRRAMALPYNRIVEAYSGRRVTMDEAGGLETVRESIDLVTAKANGP
jgi:hypothetical protein